MRGDPLTEVSLHNTSVYIRVFRMEVNLRLLVKTGNKQK